MWKSIIIWLCLSSYCLAGPVGPKRNMPIIQRPEGDIEKEFTAAASENDTNKPEAGNSNSDDPMNMQMISTLSLPSNATSIRADITDGFSCKNKSYGYYADVENDCQIFHVCMPVTYADGRENTFRWSFICPEETIFSQDSFTCMRREDMTINCDESFKYYELNRNFGVTEEDDTKPISNSNDITYSNNHHVKNEEDETSLVTNQMENEKNTIHGQIILDEKLEKQPISPMQVMTAQKEKPVKKTPKPHRRKPSTTVNRNNINKKKTTATITTSSLQKLESQATTAEPAILATTIDTLQSHVTTENKPHRFTKRPVTMAAINLKEKVQPVKQSDTLPPARVDLFNQKRKRPSIFNKKEAATLKPAAEVMPTTQLTAVGSDDKSSLFNLTPESNLNRDITTEIIATQASEFNSILIKPESILPLAIENKKTSKPQPTEPETFIKPDITKTEETPATVVPIEAIEEIPAVIAEVEENDFNKPKSDVMVSDSNNDKATIIPVTQTNVPSIFQQNSEESSPTIEEMENEKPENPIEIMLPTPDMEHQDPIIEQMLSETDTEADADANKQSMGGFKPVDPAVAADAEALIANFLNTIIRSDSTNAEPIMPTSNSVKEEILHPIEETIQSETIEPDNKPLEAVADMKPVMEDIRPFPSMIMMNNRPGDIFQIPVQVIQSSAEEQNIIDREVTPSVDVKNNVTPSQPQSQPVSIDDIVELVKDKLDQSPVISSGEKENKNADNNNKMTESIPQQQLEQIILPIYHRVSAEPNSNMITAHDKSQDVEAHKDLSNPATDSFENNNNSNSETEPKKEDPINTKISSDVDRAEGARSIKTATKMDPRKRRFLFRTDAS